MRGFPCYQVWVRSGVTCAGPFACRFFWQISRVWSLVPLLGSVSFDDHSHNPWIPGWQEDRSSECESQTTALQSTNLLAAQESRANLDWFLPTWPCFCRLRNVPGCNYHSPCVPVLGFFLPCRRRPRRVKKFRISCPQQVAKSCRKVANEPLVPLKFGLVWALAWCCACVSCPEAPNKQIFLHL